MKNLLMVVFLILSLSAVAADVMTYDKEEGFYRFNKSVVADECGDGEHSQKLVNGGRATISSTDAQGRTKIVYTFYVQTYDESQVPKGEWKTVEYFGRILPYYEEFEYNGVKYGQVIDGCTCEIGFHLLFYFDDGDGNLHLYNLLLNDGGSSDSDVSAKWRKARMLTGVWGSGCGYGTEGIRGTCVLKCGKVNKKGLAKVSLKISPFDGKKITYRSTAVNVTSGGPITVRWNGAYQVTIENDGSFSGEPIYNGERPACSPNSVWSARVGGKLPGTTAYFTMTNLQPFDLGDGWKALPSLMPWIDGCYGWEDVGSFTGFFDERPIKSCERININASTGRWSCDRAKAVKVSKVVYVPGKGVPICCPAPETAGTYYCLQLPKSGCDNYGNLSKLKLTYNMKHGTFKGTFKIYASKLYVYECLAPQPYKPKLKKVSAKVSGVVIDGEGIGSSVTPRSSCARTPMYFSCRVTSVNPDEDYYW